MIDFTGFRPLLTNIAAAIKQLRHEANEACSRQRVGEAPMSQSRYSGYSLQAVRFLQLLMESSAGSSVSLEVLEAVS